MKYLFFLIMLGGCKASQPAFLELKAYSPSQNYTTYWFGNFPNKLVLVDTANAYQFPDTIFLTKTKFMTKKEEEELEKLVPPKLYGNNYVYSIKHCPGYVGYIPGNLTHEVCKYCGQIKYYH